MSPRRRSDQERAQDIVEAVAALHAAERVYAQARGGFDEDLDLMHLDAVTYRLMSIGEAAKHLSEEARGEHPGVPWSDIIGLRDKLAHHYHRRDGQVVLAVLRDGFLGPLLQAARHITLTDESAHSPRSR